jgi:DNA-binding beta-propeller fold protein YncE
MITLLKQFMLSAVYLSILLSAGAYSEPLQEQWSTEQIFKMPESATYDAIGKQVFVSNVNVYAKDGNGFISRVSENGKSIDLHWLSELNSPTGLSANDGLLYAVDYDELLVIDISSKEILLRARTQHQKPGLNDVAVSEHGRVFVTGSSSAAIYELIDDRLELWKQDAEALKHANGLFIDKNKLIFGGSKWLIFDLKSKKVHRDFVPPSPVISEIDGIASAGDDGYFITLIDDNRLWHIDVQGRARPVSDVSFNGIDIDTDSGKLYAPIVGGGLSVYKVIGQSEELLDTSN